MSEHVAAGDADPDRLILEYEDGDAVVIGDELVFTAYIRSDTFVEVTEFR